MSKTLSSIHIPFSRWLLDGVCIGMCIMMSTNTHAKLQEAQSHCQNHRHERAVGTLYDGLFFFAGGTYCVCLVAILKCVFDLVRTPLLMMGEKELWSIHLFGFFWQRISRPKLTAVIFLDGKSKLFARSDGLSILLRNGKSISISQIFVHENKALAEKICAFYGLECRPGWSLKNVVPERRESDA